MGYQLIDPAGLEPLPGRPSTAIEISSHYVPPEDFERAAVEPAADADRGPEKIGLRLYHVAPGEAVGHRYHYHEEQEEVFYVLEGTLHVETPDREYVVEAGQVFVVEPGSPQRAFNPEGNEETAHVLAIGAPSYGELGHNDGHAYEPDGE